MGIRPCCWRLTVDGFAVDHPEPDREADDRSSRGTKLLCGTRERINVLLHDHAALLRRRSERNGEKSAVTLYSFSNRAEKRGLNSVNRALQFQTLSCVSF
ncbi:hypothetical protein BaRGS_00004320 [Batillaria attramentaria]|uniref:Uncharacterized protein n=1 Tax=Batillaria attramentaria TaxID=370345 RepID=A0ABD0LXQ2_9CAEN